MTKDYHTMLQKLHHLLLLLIAVPIPTNCDEQISVDHANSLSTWTQSHVNFNRVSSGDCVLIFDDCFEIDANHSLISPTLSTLHYADTGIQLWIRGSNLNSSGLHLCTVGYTHWNTESQTQHWRTLITSNSSSWETQSFYFPATADNSSDLRIILSTEIISESSAASCTDREIRDCCCPTCDRLWAITTSNLNQCASTGCQFNGTADGNCSIAAPAYWDCIQLCTGTPTSQPTASCFFDEIYLFGTATSMVTTNSTMNPTVDPTVDLTVRPTVQPSHEPTTSTPPQSTSAPFTPSNEPTLAPSLPTMDSVWSTEEDQSAMDNEDENIFELSTLPLLEASIVLGAFCCTVAFLCGYIKYRKRQKKVHPDVPAVDQEQLSNTLTVFDMRPKSIEDNASGVTVSGDISSRSLPGISDQEHIGDRGDNNGVELVHNYNVRPLFKHGEASHYVSNNPMKRKRKSVTASELYSTGSIQETPGRVTNSKMAEKGDAPFKMADRALHAIQWTQSYSKEEDLDIHRDDDQDMEVINQETMTKGMAFESESEDEEIINQETMTQGMKALPGQAKNNSNSKSNSSSGHGTVVGGDDV